MEQVNLKGLSRQELQDFVLSIGEKSFRAGQVWSWMYQKGAASFDEMTNISKDLRAEFKQLATISSLEEAGRRTSAVSQTVKFVWKLEDGRNIESVYIPEQDRRTVCISTQVGCAMGCVFCATGAMGFIRNLQVHEILDQIICITRIIGIKPTNIVAMGMGEPFLNYENVMKALDIINDPEGIAIGHRKITISTAGIVPGIMRYKKENRPYKLAISLNATTDTLRSRLMPVNRKYPVAALIDA